jgi:hypothetical protein
VGTLQSNVGLANKLRVINAGRRYLPLFATMHELQREYLRGARRKAQASDYFDAGDSGDERERASGASATAEEDEVDPLDAFMQVIDAQVTQERKAPPKRVADKVKRWQT